MKFIGQYIQDFIARFRSDVYLEEVSTGTIASGGNLGLDSNNKIVKADVPADGDITSVVAGTGLNGGGTSEEVTLNVDAAQPTITSVGALNGGSITSGFTSIDVGAGAIGTTGVIGAGSVVVGTRVSVASTIYAENFVTMTTTDDDTFTIAAAANGATTLTTHDEAGTAGHFEVAADGNITLDAAGDIALEAGGADISIAADHITFTSASASDPQFKLISTTNDANGCQLQLRNNKGAAGADGDGIGSIRFIGDDAAQAQTEFGKIICQVSEADNTDEAGKIRFMVASSDGTTTALTNGLIIEGEHATASEVDVTIANGSASTTTISGNLNVIGNVLPGITYIKILPSDFMPDDVGRPAMIDDTGSDRWLESHSTAKLFAYVDIPVGFKATHVDVYGSATSAVTVYEADVNSKTVTSKGTGNIGTQINITDVSSDATNYILIELAQASGEEVYGGNLTIAKI